MFGDCSANPNRTREAADEDPVLLLLGTSTPTREIARALNSLAQSDINLLIQGEPGTGKRILAEEIHARSSRAREPFVKVTLEGLTERQAERELFGDEGVGRLLRLGYRVTLYLESVEALGCGLQTRLATAIAEGQWSKLRIITGTTAPLDELVRLGRFRPDLVFKLGVVRFTLPPLRERREDIGPIVEHFTRRWCEKSAKARLNIARAAIAELGRYAWPGNVRELQQTLEAALAVTRSGEVSLERVRAILGRRPQRYAAPDVFPLRQLERDYIMSVLMTCNWNQSLAARRLGIGRNTLLRKIRSFGLGKAAEAA